MSNNTGSLEIIIGPMFSGKTTELMRRVKRHMVINNKILIINSIKDTRCDSEIKSHDNSVLNAIKLEKLYDLQKNKEVDLKSYNVVAIDESQFFGDLVNFVTDVLLQVYKMHVIVTGLNGDSNQNLFGQTILLITHADRIDLLSGLCTICGDGTPGCFSKRIIEDSSQTLVGGKESYKCVCRRHL